MTFDELVEEVYNLTARADLVAETKSAVKAATLKAHKSDFYSKDIFETGVEFEEKNFRQSWDYIDLIPNYRALKYFRLSDDDFSDTGPFIEVITPEEILDNYDRNRTNIAYVAGRVLEIRAECEFDKALVGCYVLPIVRELDYSSWVAEQYPFAIIYEAARVVFMSKGQAEESRNMAQLLAEEYVELKQGALADVGS